MVRVLASHQCGPGSNPGPGVISGLSLLLVLALAPRAFLRVFQFFPPPQKSAFLNSNSIGNSRASGLSVVDCCVDCCVLPSLIYLFIYSCPSCSKGGQCYMYAVLWIAYRKPKLSSICDFIVDLALSMVSITRAEWQQHFLFHFILRFLHLVA